MAEESYATLFTLVNGDWGGVHCLLSSQSASTPPTHPKGDNKFQTPACRPAASTEFELERKSDKVEKVEEVGTKALPIVSTRSIGGTEIPTAEDTHRRPIVKGFRNPLIKSSTRELFVNHSFLSPALRA